MKKLILLLLLSMPYAWTMEQEDAKELAAAADESMSIDECLQKYRLFINDFIKKEFSYPDTSRHHSMIEKGALEKLLHAHIPQVENALKNKSANTGSLTRKDAEQIFIAALHQGRTTHLRHKGYILDTHYNYVTFDVRNEDGTYHGRTRGLWPDIYSQTSFNVNWVSDATGKLIEKLPIEESGQ